jgi:hypothetical protein
VNKFLPVFLSWTLKEVILPLFSYMLDVIKLGSINKKNQKVVEDLKNAKSPADIDSAIDRLP